MRKRTKGTVAAALTAAVVALVALEPSPAPAAIADFGVESVGAALSSPEAGAHADFEFRFKVAGITTAEPGVQKRPWAGLRNLAVEMPPGLLGNPAAVPTCRQAVFADATLGKFCPAETQVGLIEPGAFGQIELGTYATPLYNLEPPPGAIAQFGAMILFMPVFIELRLDPARDDAVTATMSDAPTVTPITGATTTLWGVPASPVHDSERFNWVEAMVCGGTCRGPVPSEIAPKPFMSNPTRCGSSEVGIAAESYEGGRGFDYEYAPLPEITGCEAVPFEPTMSISPTTGSAATPTGLEVDLEVPQEGLKNPQAPASAVVREARLELPEGISLDPSALDGLDGCDETQIGATRDERQVVDVGGGGAPVSLSFDGDATSWLPPFATASEVRASLEGLPGVDIGDVMVEGRSGGPWTVAFGGSLADRDVQPVGGTHGEMQRLTMSAAGGGYSLGYSGQWTAPLPLGATAPAVQAALEQLPDLGPGNVEVVGGPVAVRDDLTNEAFDIFFGGTLSGVDVGKIDVASSLTGTKTVLEVSDVVPGGAAISTHTTSQGGSLRFGGGPVGCPTDSQVATGTVVTPLFREPLDARVYLARQGANPAAGLFAGYVVTEGGGARLTLPIRFDADSETGRVLATVENPTQLPLSELKLQFKEGDRGLFTTPAECGTYTSGYRLVPSTGGPPVTGTSRFTLDRDCGPRPFRPTFAAGSTSALAGAFSSFSIQVRRERGSAPLGRISVDLPQGLAARLAGVGRCPEETLAMLDTAPGSGAAEVARPACPAASQVGTVTAGLGSGLPLYVQTGKVYLAGPYRDAPLSLAIVLPTVAGPFDLGNAVVRVAVSLDPETAGLELASDPLPGFVGGIPLEIRDLRILIDRPGFLTNPTDCGEKAVTGVVRAATAAEVRVSNRFQVGDCAALGFRPRANLGFSGAVGRNGHPQLTVAVRPRAADANIAGAAFSLPAGELLDVHRIPALCRGPARPDLCPRRSRIGYVELRTPLLERPLAGPVYALEPARGLPAVLADLRSGGFHLVLRGHTATRAGRLTMRFPSIPDVPFSRLRFSLAGGRRGFVVNSESLCARPIRAKLAFTAHNGRSTLLHPTVDLAGEC